MHWHNVRLGKVRHFRQELPEKSRSLRCAPGYLDVCTVRRLDGNIRRAGPGSSHLQKPGKSTRRSYFFDRFLIRCRWDCVSRQRDDVMKVKSSWSVIARACWTICIVGNSFSGSLKTMTLAENRNTLFKGTEGSSC